VRNLVRLVAQFAVVAGVVVAATGLSASAASAADPSLSLPPRSQTGVPLELIPTSPWARVNTLAMQQGALGTYRDKSTQEIVAVVPASGISWFTKEGAASLGIDAPVRVVTANIDQPTIDAIQARLRDLRPVVPNTYSYGSYFDPEKGAVLIGSDAPQSAFSSVMADYRGQVVYEHTSPSLQSRIDDYAPHWGGSWLQDAAGEHCTAGYSVYLGSYHGIVTAAHCFPLGDSIHDPSGNWFGGVNWRHNYPDTDAEILYGSSYQGMIYADPTVAYYPVRGYSLGVVGASYCVSGSGTYIGSQQIIGNTCGHTDTSNSLQFCSNEYPPPGCANDLIVMEYGNFTVPGDSGAPWYVVGGSGNTYGAYILGSHVGTNSYQMFVEPYTKVHSVYGASVLVY
jgi:hypothetical protein